MKNLKDVSYLHFICVMLEIMKEGIKVMDAQYIRKCPVLEDLPPLEDIVDLLSGEPSLKPMRKVYSNHIIHYYFNFKLSPCRLFTLT